MHRDELRKIIEQRLRAPGRTVHFDHKKDSMRIIQEKSGRGVTLSLPDLMRRYNEAGPEALREMLAAVARGLKAMDAPLQLKGQEKRIFPVIRAASFPDHTPDGRTLITQAHTAETRIFYALDLGGACRLIDDRLLDQEGLDARTVRAWATANLNALPVKMKKDVVRHNAFYFINMNDGYDASRILSRKLVMQMRARAKGELTCALPHQDVLIFGDIVNPEGYDILAQMTMNFYTAGDLRITMLPFIIDEKGNLDPVFIMANKRPFPGEK